MNVAVTALAYKNATCLHSLRNMFLRFQFLRGSYVLQLYALFFNLCEVKQSMRFLQVCVYFRWKCVAVIVSHRYRIVE